MQQSIRDGKREKAEPNSDATSKETVADVSENEADSSTDEAQPAPSPDGAFDKSDEGNEAGPM